MIPILMMMIIILSGQMVISSMAMEKENKTLETLLTLPVKRTSIVAGKILASAIVGLFLAFIYMIGMSYYLASVSFSGTTGAAIDLSLSAIDFVLFGILLFITLLAALSLCMLLGTMAKNYKSAQTLIFPVIMMAIFSMLITMFMDFDTLPLGLKGLVFAIPFSHPMMAMRALMFNDYTLIITGIIYISIFTIIVIALVVWIFKTDKLLTGSMRLKRMVDKYNKK
jgi:ABC-2 type transport system permease protein